MQKSASATRRSMSGRTKPFLLSPAAKDYLWGGSRLNDDFNKGIPMFPLAETWECSIHPDGQSVVASGEYVGSILGEVLEEHPEWLGSHAAAVGNGKLPILIKLIDARADLSVQVHPDDEYSLRVEGQQGKTEMWYVLDARPDASLVYGFSRDVEKDGIRRAVAEDRIGEYLNWVPIRRDDVFFIPAGTVHALGAGALVTEVQENSNVTYRLYDYGRGRETHVEKALDVANLSSSAAPRQPMRVLRYRNGAASELLCRCKYFQVERVLLNTEARKMPSFQARENSFHALLCVAGCGVILGDGVDMPFFKGDCIFVPADSIPLRLHGRAQMLNISC